MTFDDLDFKLKGDGLSGVQATAFFDNGYGVSVIKGPYSYGGDKGLYELAVFKGDENDHSLCYDTPITGDVLGHLTESDVTTHIAEVEALPHDQ